MSVELKLVDGKPAVSIAAADGEVFDYFYDLLPGDVWGCLLTKLEEGQQMETYRVLLYPSGAWNCDCRQAMYRRGLCNERGGCKHVLCCRELKQILDVMQGKTDPSGVT